ncbi:cytochrome P450 [Solwaraspora sp. WMMD406]|uniref:cytochrome P450 n=1 Tax=Solwaraspora sp. WMMD406 TaxID=3016095 RepID=UPI002417E2FE|nr:cytochrome P450 [Solwaraspora sp. WMMD406]MDG4765936.1 cytochrome P450 [Solwaraspora sp. WMMD406]
MAGRGGNGRRPPGPRGHWLTGNTRAYETDRIGFLRRCHHEHGDVFSFDDRTVCVIDPDLAHDVLTRTDHDFLTEQAPFDANPDLDRAAARAGDWMTARRTVWPGLNRHAAAAADTRTVEILDRVLVAAGGDEIDVLDTMRRFTARLIADYCFGPEDTTDSDVPGLLADGIDATAAFETTTYALPAWLPLPRHRRFFRVHRRTVDALTELVRRRRAAGPRTPGGDLLDHLLAADPAMPDRAVVSTLRAVLVGGHGVPAAALASMVRELARRPRLASDLRDEADAAADDDGRPAARQPLAEAVVSEVLRLHPPAWLMTRTARSTTALGPWTVHPGDEVLLNVYLIHRDPRWWPDRPDEFDPDRWLSGRPAPGRTYLPFGAGPRVCLGSASTMRQLTLVTARLAQRFTIDSPNADSAVPVFAGRLAPAGLRARFRPVQRRVRPGG